MEIQIEDWDDAIRKCSGRAARLAAARPVFAFA